MIKRWWRTAGELALVILLVPQVFVLCYYFPLFFKHGRPFDLLRPLALYALTLSWVSAPVLVVLSLAVLAVIKTRVRSWLTFLVCGCGGYLLIFAWNRFVFPTFTYWRSVIPVAVCSLGTAGYALAKAIYRDGLPSEKPKNETADLPE